MSDLSSLLASRKPLALLVGAGISIDAPSNLFPGAPFVESVLDRICPQDVDRDWMQSIRHLPRTELRRPGEFLRFETLMSALVQSGLDPELSVLRCLDECDRPNRNHFVCAELLRRGVVVLTTNFDSLIEIAYATLFGDCAPPLRIAYEDAQFPPGGPAANEPPTLWKLHGSLSVDGVNTARTAQSTFYSVLSQALSTRKTAFLRQVAARYHLLMLGYSGSDDLDLIPVLAEGRPLRGITWVNHAGSPLAVRPGTQVLKEWGIQNELDAVGQARVLFRKGELGVHVVSGPTAAVMDALIAEYQLPAGYPLPPGFPLDRDRYFAEWAAGLGGGESSPYRLILHVFSGRWVRPADAERLNAVRTRLHQIRTRPDAVPADRLAELVEDYAHAESHFAEISAALDALWDALPESALVEAQKLRASLAWRQSGPEEGEKAFAAVAGLAREKGDFLGEITSLTTWRAHAGFNEWTEIFWEHLSDSLREQVPRETIDHLRGVRRSFRVMRPGGLGGRLLPEQAGRRLVELGRETGYLPLLYAQNIRSLRDHASEHSLFPAILVDQALDMERYAIDMGDVFGEAEAAVVCAQLAAASGEHFVAAEEAFRALELNRIVGNDQLAFDARQILQLAGKVLGEEDVEWIGELLREPMWNV